MAGARVEVGAVDRQCEGKGSLLALGGETLARKRPRRRIGQADVVELHLDPGGRRQRDALAVSDAAANGDRPPGGRGAGARGKGKGRTPEKGCANHFPFPTKLPGTQRAKTCGPQWEGG